MPLWALMRDKRFAIAALLFAVFHIVLTGSVQLLTAQLPISGMSLFGRWLYVAAGDYVIFVDLVAFPLTVLLSLLVGLNVAMYYQVRNVCPINRGTARIAATLSPSLFATSLSCCGGGLIALVVLAVGGASGLSAVAALSAMGPILSGVAAVGLTANLAYLRVRLRRAAVPTAPPKSEDRAPYVVEGGTCGSCVLARREALRDVKGVDVVPDLARGRALLVVDRDISPERVKGLVDEASRRTGHGFRLNL